VRVLDLLPPERRPAQPDTSHGYLDLLGGDSATGGHAGQRLMENPALVRVYERVWRPFWGRLFMGAMGPGAASERDIAVEMLELGDGDTVLDVGCGPGNFTRAFAEEVPGGLVVGLDASGPMLVRAVEETAAGNIEYVRGDASDLPFKDASFDGVCCFAALYLIDDPYGALDEIVRVLRPGGRVALLSSVNRGLAPTMLSNAVVKTMAGVRVFGRDEITDALRKRGMKRVAQRVRGLAQFVSARKGGGSRTGGGAGR
jgi:ubiquinone/menaquinone biosynthesis C-methylase UbiE